MSSERRGEDGNWQHLSQTLILGVVSFCCRNSAGTWVQWGVRTVEERVGGGGGGQKRMDEGVLLVRFCCSVEADWAQKGKLLFFITEQQPRKKATSLSHLQCKSWINKSAGGDMSCGSDIDHFATSLRRQRLQSHQIKTKSQTRVKLYCRKASNVAKHGLQTSSSSGLF